MGNIADFYTMSLQKNRIKISTEQSFKPEIVCDWICKCLWIPWYIQCHLWKWVNDVDDDDHSMQWIGWGMNYCERLFVCIRVSKRSRVMFEGGFKSCLRDMLHRLRISVAFHCPYMQIMGQYLQMVHGTLLPRVLSNSPFTIIVTFDVVPYEDDKAQLSKPRRKQENEIAESYMFRWRYPSKSVRLGFRLLMHCIRWNSIHWSNFVPIRTSCYLRMYMVIFMHSAFSYMGQNSVFWRPEFHFLHWFWIRRYSVRFS